MVEKEIFVVVKAVENFKNIIFNAPDNKNGQPDFIYDSTSTTRIQRWKLYLQEYDIILEHIVGKQNNIADALLRFVVTEETKNPDI